MKVSKLELQNINSFGAQKQVIEFDNDGALILLHGKNGSGKCLSPDTEIVIDIENELIKEKFTKFIENRKYPL